MAVRKFTRKENFALALQFATHYQRAKNFHLMEQTLVAEWQFRRVQRLVDMAYHHTELYWKKYDSIGIHPRDIRSWQDFKRLPILTKEDLIEAGTGAVNDRLKIDELLVSRSSGSTGEFVTIYLDPQAMVTQAIQAVRMIKEMCPCYGPLDRELLIYTSEYPYSSIGGLYRATYAHTLLSTHQLLERISETRPTIIAVYPSILRDIVRVRGSNDPIRHVKTIITNSEQSLQEERGHFARQLGCPVYDEFSSEELSSIAYQCRHLQYHVTQDSSYVEVLSPSADTDMPPGQLGEIVGTCLINTAMPIIRYRQGDLATLSYASCPCGRTGPVLRALAGRKNDSFKRPDGTEVPSGRILDWTYDLILTHKLGVREFQITQQTRSRVEVHLVVEPSYDDSIANQIITSNFRKTFGDGFDVAILVVPAIGRTRSGKYNPIRSLV